jgi:hypothetical protein
MNVCMCACRCAKQQKMCECARARTTANQKHQKQQWRINRRAVSSADERAAVSRKTVGEYRRRRPSTPFQNWLATALVATTIQSSVPAHTRTHKHTHTNDNEFEQHHVKRKNHTNSKTNRATITYYTHTPKELKAIPNNTHVDQTKQQPPT